MYNHETEQFVQPFTLQMDAVYKDTNKIISNVQSHTLKHQDTTNQMAFLCGILPQNLHTLHTCVIYFSSPFHIWKKMYLIVMFLLWELRFLWGWILRLQSPGCDITQSGTNVFNVSIHLQAAYILKMKAACSSEMKIQVSWMWCRVLACIVPDILKALGPSKTL